MNSKKFAAEDAAHPMNHPGFVFRELHRGGFEVEALLRGTTLAEERFRDSNARLEFSTLRRFILNAIVATDDPHLGLRLALRFEANYSASTILSAMNAPRCVDGLRNLIRFAHLTFPDIAFAFQSRPAFQSRQTLRTVAGYGFI